VHTDDHLPPNHPIGTPFLGGKVTKTGVIQAKNSMNLDPEMTCFLQLESVTIRLNKDKYNNRSIPRCGICYQEFFILEKNISTGTTNVKYPGTRRLEKLAARHVLDNHRNVTTLIFTSHSPGNPYAMLIDQKRKTWWPLTEKESLEDIITLKDPDIAIIQPQSETTNCIRLAIDCPGNTVKHSCSECKVVIKQYNYKVGRDNLVNKPYNHTAAFKIFKDHVEKSHMHRNQEMHIMIPKEVAFAQFPNFSSLGSPHIIYKQVPHADPHSSTKNFHTSTKNKYSHWEEFNEVTDTTIQANPEIPSAGPSTTTSAPIARIYGTTNPTMINCMLCDRKEHIPRTSSWKEANNHIHNHHSLPMLIHFTDKFSKVTLTLAIPGENYETAF
jgi:hypothetical protein